MSKKIIFQKCHFNNIYFLFYIIMDFINLLIEYKFTPVKFEEGLQEHNYYLAQQILINLYIYNLSDFVAIIPYLIRKKLMKKKEDIEVETEDKSNIDDSTTLIYNDNKELVYDHKKKSVKYYCIVISILDFLQKFSPVLYSIIFPDQVISSYSFSCYISFEIILQFICSHFILKIRFNKLQYFSLFLNLGLFIIILTIDLINILKFQSFDGKSFYFYIFSIFFYSMEYSYVKQVLLYGFLSIYLFMLIKGCLLLILVSVFSLIIFLTKKDVVSRIGYFLTNSPLKWLILAKVFANFFLNLFLWIIIDRYSPNYYPFVLIFDQFFVLLLDKFIDSTEYNTMGFDLYIRIFLNIISTIGVMIHNEVVVINICNLGSDTKYFLDLEVKSEELFAKTSDPEIIKRYDSFNEMEEFTDEKINTVEAEGEKTSE